MLLLGAGRQTMCKMLISKSVQLQVQSLIALRKIIAVVIQQRQPRSRELMHHTR